MNDDPRAAEPILPDEERPTRRRRRPQAVTTSTRDFLHDYRDQRMNEREDFGSYEPDVV